MNIRHQLQRLSGKSENYIIWGNVMNEIPKGEFE